MKCYSSEDLASAISNIRSQGLAYRTLIKASSIQESLVGTHSFPHVINKPFPLQSNACFEVSVASDIGNEDAFKVSLSGSRKSQEDRLVVALDLINGRRDSGFFGVFDGTVEFSLGEFASNTVKDLVLPHLLNSPAWANICNKLTLGGGGNEAQNTSSGISTAESVAAFGKNKDHANSVNIEELLMRAHEWMYLNADAELLEMCEKEKKNYASSTAVTAIFAAGYGCIGHLGDSRIAIGYERGGRLIAEFLTEDHKPNQFIEQERIIKSGGSVEYLHNHNNRPFIRGGDFTERKQKGEQPMQLQYSRAFGGKDLKMYGLSREPDLRVFKLEPFHHVMILASDGVWDVQSAYEAIEIAMVSRLMGGDPAGALIQATLNTQKMLNQNADNLTAIIVFFRGEECFERQIPLPNANNMFVTTSNK